MGVELLFKLDNSVPCILMNCVSSLFGLNKNSAEDESVFQTSHFFKFTAFTTAQSSICKIVLTLKSKSVIMLEQINDSSSL